MTDVGDVIRPLFPELSLPDTARVGLLRAILVGPDGSAARTAVETVKPAEDVADTDWVTVSWDDAQLLSDAVPAPLIVSDTFDGSTINAAKWTVVGSPTVSSGKLRLPVSYPNGGVRSVVTGVINNRTATLYGLVTNVGSKNAGLIGMQLQSTAAPATQWLAFVRYQPNPGYLLMQVGTPRSTATLVYNASTHANIRMRVVSPSIFFESSPDGLSWTTLGTLPSPSWAANQGRLFVYSGSGTSGGADLAAISTVDRVTWG